MSDPVNHPAHYNAHPSGIEAIEVCEHLSFSLGNAVKYLWRAGSKDDRLQDLKKARWYVEREISRRRCLRWRLRSFFARLFSEAEPEWHAIACVVIESTPPTDVLSCVLRRLVHDDVRGALEALNVEIGHEVASRVSIAQPN